MAKQRLPEPHRRQEGREGRERAGLRRSDRSGTLGLARGLFILSLVIAAVPVAFAIFGQDSGSDFLTALPVFVMAYSGVGALIAMRNPSNAIGWLFLSIGLVAAIEPASIAYLTHPSLLPADSGQRGRRNG
jgi:hypothetical protein